MKLSAVLECSAHSTGYENVTLTSVVKKGNITYNDGSLQDSLPREPVVAVKSISTATVYVGNSILLYNCASIT